MTKNFIFFFKQITSYLNKDNITVATSLSFNGDPPMVEIDPTDMIFLIGMDHDNFPTRPLFNVTL